MGLKFGETPKQWVDDEIGWQPSPWGFGQAGALDGYGPNRDIIGELRKVVEEVTGKPIALEKQRIGFLP